MWTYNKVLEYPINIKCPNPRLAKFIISQYGGPDGELAASLRYLSQRFGMPDQKALCLHREYTKQLKDLKDKYQKMYGPLTIYYPCNKWRWLEEPWPWERGNY